ncbi:MAG: DUF2400 domain-containing protein [Treponema sp.]|nr:DUF2400 domain-containing protein [Treponema sp.]
MDRKDIKNFLDNLYAEINKPEFIPLDPVQFPRRYSKKPDVEIAAFLAAVIAWGRRDLIIKSCEKMFAILGSSPHAYIMNGDFRKPPPGKATCKWPGELPLRQLKNTAALPRGINIHRTFFEDDLFYFCRGLKACYSKYGSLEALFASAKGVWEGIGLFRDTMAGANGGCYSKHFADPASNSACKRLHLALRWLVRREGPVDLGIWKSLSPSSLFIPLDLHVGRAARLLGLLEGRKANDKKAVISLTEKLKEFCPQDPIKYDFALFGYSMMNSAVDI